MGTLSCISGRARGVDECVRMLLLIVITLLGGAGAAVYFLGLDQVLQLLGVKPLTKQELSDYKNPLIKNKIPIKPSSKKTLPKISSIKWSARPSNKSLKNMTAHRVKTKRPLTKPPLQSSILPPRPKHLLKSKQIALPPNPKTSQ